MTTRVRADALVLQQGLAQNIAHARSLILAGVVLLDNGQRVEKAGDKLLETHVLRLKGEHMPYVSRGGLKLEAALNTFHVDVKNAVCVDFGASTGGFTDCLLQRGASKVYAVDVGYGQLDWKLRSNPCVVVLDRSNLRFLDVSAIPQLCDVVVADVSFISLKATVPSMLRFAREGAWVVLLVKPQFEVLPHEVGEGGVVQDPALRERVLAEMLEASKGWGLVGVQTCDSPVLGAKGNHEYLLVGQCKK
jgi:23S rRNA (cytidine1920-2'-O)/16S rRNA (cytidine1409-2'-O)-methyltransferase